MKLYYLILGFLLYGTSVGFSQNIFPATGNVGIGTTTPTNRLEVSGSTFNRVSAISTANVQTGFQLRRAFTSFATDWELYVPASSTDLRFYNVEDRLTLLANGNVGIGTAVPTVKLNVYNQGNATTVNIGSPSAGSGGFTLLKLGTSADMNGYSFIQSTKSSGTAYGDIVMNASGGNVGIGTTIPDTKLAVKGTIHAQEVKVDLSVPGPDYVFEETYILPSLTDTENYIKQNKHLPEVPNACEMEEKGINLSEMNMVLLKKVEELTLYIIDQEKRIAQLEQSRK